MTSEDLNKFLERANQEMNEILRLTESVAKTSGKPQASIVSSPVLGTYFIAGTPGGTSYIIHMESMVKTTQEGMKRIEVAFRNAGGQPLLSQVERLIKEYAQ